MALKSVSGGTRNFITPDESVASTSLETGGSLEGFLIQIDSYVDKDGLTKTPLFFKKEDGKIMRVYPSGNIRYAIEDGKLTIGQFTRITRVEDKKVKGKVSSQFEILQDDENVIEDVPAILEEVYAASRAAYLARKDANAPVGSVTSAKGMTKTEKSRANIKEKAKLLD